MLSEAIVNDFLLTEDLSTYDPYDIWKTDLGVWVKRLYFKNKYVGLFPAAALTIFDLYVNNSRRVGYKKQEFPIVRAQAALSLLQLYNREPRPAYLEFAEKHINWLLSNASQGYSGLCWGTGFRIVASSSLTYSPEVPFSTNTPYCLEAIYLHFKTTGDEKDISLIEKIFMFYENNLEVIYEDDDSMITSYGPSSDRVVTNAVSYTLLAYAIFYKTIESSDRIKSKIRKLYSFLRGCQQADGSWYYAPFDSGSFIDCFHSAFVLKNLIKSSRLLDFELPYIENVVSSGYAFVNDNFLDRKTGLYSRFAVSNKPSVVRFDLYDNAEMLSLCKLIGDTDRSLVLDSNIQSFFFDKKIFSSIDVFNQRKNPDMLRWAVMPYVLAISS